MKFFLNNKSKLFYFCLINIFFIQNFYINCEDNVQRKHKDTKYKIYLTNKINTIYEKNKNGIYVIKYGVEVLQIQRLNFLNSTIYIDNRIVSSCFFSLICVFFFESIKRCMPNIDLKITICAFIILIFKKDFFKKINFEQLFKAIIAAIIVYYLDCEKYKETFDSLVSIYGINSVKYIWPICIKFLFWFIFI